MPSPLFPKATRLFDRAIAMIKISSDLPGRIKVAFPYNAEYIARIKTVRAHRWHPEEKYWSFPSSRLILKEILSAFAGEDLDIDPSLQILISQDQIERTTHRPLQKEPSPIQVQETAKEAPLVNRVRDLIRLKHYSIRTEKSYLSWILRYIDFHNKRDPKEMATPEIEAFLSHLAVDLKVSASTQNQAFNALLFLYKGVLKKELDDSIDAIRAKKPKRLPTVMTKEEALKVIGAIPADHQLMVKLIYGGGLRLMECLRLRVKDIDFGNSQLLIRDAKGMKDRITVLPDSLKPSLKDHLERVKLIHQSDVVKGYGRVYLP